MISPVDGFSVIKFKVSARGDTINPASKMMSFRLRTACFPSRWLVAKEQKKPERDQLRPVSGVAQLHGQLALFIVQPRPAILEFVCRRAVLPDGVTERLRCVRLQVSLDEQSGDESGQQVAAAALGQPKVAGGFINFAAASANERLVAFKTTQQWPKRFEISRTACGRFCCTCADGTFQQARLHRDGG